MGFLKRIRSEVKPFFIHGEPRSDQEIVVKVIQADNAYTAELTPNHDAVKHWAPKLEKTPSEYVLMLQEALEGSGDEGNKKVQNIFEIQNSYLVWRQPVAGKDMKVLLGKIPMEKETFTETVGTILSDVFDELNQCREQIRKLDKERQDLHKEHEEAIALAESSVKKKEEIERELYGKFSLLLNSKKNKIRQLKTQGLNCSVTSNPGLSQLSPYLNFDPSYLQTTQPDFITLEGASQKRGRFELAFSQIGGLCMIGASLGGTHGFYRGLQETSAAGHTGKIRRTQLLNYVMKRGSASANTLGVVAVMYSGLGCLLYWGRGSHEDELNTLGAGTLTGLLYKSTAGLRKCAIGGAVGLALSAAYIAFSSRDKLKQQYGN